MHFVLASASPRRLALLAQIGIVADVRPSNFAEIEGVDSSAYDVVRTNALGKGREVLQACQKSDVVIAADTVVALNSKILGKPKDAAEAKAIKRRPPRSAWASSVRSSVESPALCLASVRG